MTLLRVGRRWYLILHCETVQTSCARVSSKAELLLSLPFGSWLSRSLDPLWNTPKHALRWTISILSLFGLEFTVGVHGLVALIFFPGKLEFMGFPRFFRRRSRHDAGFVLGR